MQRVVAVLEERRVARRHGLRDTAALLRRELQVSAGEARSRVAAANQLAADAGLDAGGEVGAGGEAGPPNLVATARAQAWGQPLPGARAGDPTGLGRAAARATRYEGNRAGGDAGCRGSAARSAPAGDAGPAAPGQLDPDRLRRQDEEQQRLRAGSFVRHPDGSSDVRAHLTPVGTAIFEAAILPLTAPQPDDAAGRDEREPKQRFHDGLVEGCRRLLVAKDVPGEGGVPATVIAIVPLADLTDQVGTARTQYGTELSIADLLKVAGEAMVVPVVVDDAGAPLHVGRSRRFATTAQTYALIARDKGCSFPECDHPPPWTQRHHIRAWLDGGPTDIDNLTLLCPYHHANFAALGWECLLIDRVVHWVPPAAIDPQRRPIRNVTHDRATGGWSRRGERAA